MLYVFMHVHIHAHDGLVHFLTQVHFHLDSKMVVIRMQFRLWAV